MLILKMKKVIITAFLITLFGILVLPMVVLAQTAPPTPTAGTGELLPTKPAFEVLGNVMRWLWTTLLVVAVVVIIIAAYMFVTAAGNPEALGKARNLVLYAVVAIILAAIAWGIVGIARRAAEG